MTARNSMTGVPWIVGNSFTASICCNVIIEKKQNLGNGVFTIFLALLNMLHIVESHIAAFHARVLFCAHSIV